MIRQTGILLVGDLLALLAFVFLGQLDHGMIAGNPLPRLLETTAQLTVPWVIVAALLGAYRVEPGAPGRMWLGRALNAWLVAVPLALLLRALLRGQPVIFVAFFVVTLGLGGLFLLGWRLVYAVALARFRRHLRT